MELKTATCNCNSSVTSTDDKLVTSNKRHVLCTGERNILKNLYESLRAQSPELKVRELVQLCSDLTKVSTSTIFRILKERKQNVCSVSVVANKQKRGPKKIVLNNDVINSIRRKMHSFYSRNEIPTIKKLQHELGNDESLPKISRRVLLRTLREMNIRTKDGYNLTEELDGNCSLQTTDINTMPNSASNRKKIKPDIPENGSMSAVDTLETVESEFLIDRVKLENMESMETIEQFGIKDAGTPYTESDIKGNKDITMSDTPSGRVKSEIIEEMWDRPDYYIMDKMDEIETVDSQVLISGATSKYNDSTELNEQLDNKSKGDASILLLNESDTKDEDDDSSTNISDIAKKKC